MPRAQFRDTLMLRGPGPPPNALTAPPLGVTATASLYDVGTSNPISEPIYADNSSATTLSNPVTLNADGALTFWLAEERELDLVVSCPGYTPQRTTVTTDGVTANAATIPLNQNLTFSPDNTYDIGASATGRPRDLWLGRNLSVLGTVTVPAGSIAGTAIASGGITSTQLAAGAAATNVGTLSGVLGGTLPSPSMAAGAAAANVGALSGVLGGTLPSPTMAAGAAATNVGTLGGSLSGTLPNPTLSATALNPWSIATGHLTVSPDNTYDVGAVGANRPRNVYVAGAFVGNGAVPVGGASGQVLAKTSAADYALGWTTPSVGITLPLSQSLTFSADITYDVGQPANRVRFVYGNTVDTTLVGPSAAAALTLQTGGTSRWRIVTAGHWQAILDNTYDIGAVGAARPRNVYAAGAYIGNGAVPTGGASGQVLSKSAATDYALVWTTPAAGITIPLSQNLTFTPDNTYDIGAVAATRPRNIYAAGAFIGNGAVPTGGTTGQVLSKSSATDYALAWITPAGGAPTYPLLAPNGTAAAPSYSFAAATNSGMYLVGGIVDVAVTGTLILALTNTAIVVYGAATLGGGLAFSPDNIYDIGAVASSRPRSIYAGTSFIGPGAVPTGGTAGQVLAKNTATNYDLIWSTPAAGITIPLSQNLTFTPDTTYDIGASGANRPRDLWLGRNLSVVGTTATGVVGIGTAPVAGQAISISSANVRLRQPASDATSISLETATGYSFQCGRLGAQLAFNAYYDGAAWQRFVTTDASAQWALVGFGITYLTTVAGSGSISWGTTKFSIDLNGNVLIAGYQDTTEIAKPANPAAGFLRIYPKSDNKLYTLDSTGLETQLGAGGGLTIPLSQNLTFSPDATYDIGAVAATRPRNVYAAGAHIGNGAVPVGGTAGQVLAKSSATDYALTWTTPAGGITIPLSQNLTFTPDVTYDIGAAGASRPRSLYVGAAGIYLGVSPRLRTMANDVNSLSLESQAWVMAGGKTGSYLTTNAYYDGTNWQPYDAAQPTAFIGVSNGRVAFFAAAASPTVTPIQTGEINSAAANLYVPLTFNTDNLYDIGTSGGNRPRDLFLAGNLTVPAFAAIGTTPATTTGLSLGSSALTGTSPFGARLLPIFPGTATGNPKVLEAGFSTAAAAFTATTGAAINLAAPVIGAGSAVTTMRGILIASQGAAGITNAYGIYINAQSGATTTNIGLYNAGTTQLNGATQVNGAFSLAGAPDSRAAITVNAGAASYMTGTDNWVVKMDATGTAGATGDTIGLRFFVQTASAAYTSNNLIGIRILPPQKNAPALVNNTYGLLIDPASSGSVSNYGVWIGAMSGGTTNIGLYNTGTSQLQGVVGIGIAPNSIVTTYVKAAVSHTYAVLIDGATSDTTTYAFMARNLAGGTIIGARDDGLAMLATATGALSFFGATGTIKGAVTGSRAGNAALASLLTTLANYGLLTDSSTA
jgi:hypothetical protein